MTKLSIRSLPLRALSVSSLSIILSVAGTSSTQAQNIKNASPISVYGLIDIGTEYLNNAGAKGGGLLRIHSGGMNTSRIGFKGVEDIGGGMQSFFQLEAGFLPDTGAASESQHIFNRQANLGLAGQYGKILLGRSDSTTGDFYSYDPIGNNYSWSGVSTTLRGGRKDGTLSRVSNLIKYEGKFNGYRIGASYGLGEAAGNQNTNAKYAMGVEYVRRDFGLVMTYDRENSNTAFPGYNRVSNVHVSGAYTFPWAKLYAGYRRHTKNTTTASQNLLSDFIWLGVSRALSGSLTLSGAIYHVNMRNDPKGNNANPTMYVALLKYGMSPRTDLYLTGAYANVKNSQPVGVANYANSYSESGTQVGFNMGVQHRF